MQQVSNTAKTPYQKKHLDPVEKATVNTCRTVASFPILYPFTTIIHNIERHGDLKQSIKKNPSWRHFYRGGSIGLLGTTLQKFPFFLIVEKFVNVPPSHLSII